MEPRIQYAKTADGVSIAYWTLGEGMPVVEMPAGMFSHIQLEWQTPQLRRWYERIAQNRMLVRYDGRGTGLSDRDVDDYTLDSLAFDLDAVVDRLGLQRFCLFGLFEYAPVAIKYAVQHPERVTHLILWIPMARPSDAPPGWQAFEELMDTDWSLFSEAMAGLLGGEPEEVRAASVFIRESVTPETAKAIRDAQPQHDVTALLPKVTVPTLVLHRPEAQFTDVDVAKRLVSQIPDARLVLLEGTSGFTTVGDVEPVLEAIDEFLSEGDEESNKSATPAPSGLVTILFADMESSTTLRRNLGDVKVQELVRKHNEIVRDALKASGGSEIKHTGDGIMASFATATSALECSIAIQQGVTSHVEQEPDMPLAVYIGLNAGEPIAEEHDLYGTSVDLAARICDHAEPGQILASNVVRELSEGKGFLFGDIGDVVPKGFEEPVRLYEVRWRGED